MRNPVKTFEDLPVCCDGAPVSKLLAAYSQDIPTSDFRMQKA